MKNEIRRPHHYETLEFAKEVGFLQAKLRFLKRKKSEAGRYVIKWRENLHIGDRVRVMEQEENLVEQKGAVITENKPVKLGKKMYVIIAINKNGEFILRRLKSRVRIHKELKKTWKKLESKRTWTEFTHKRKKTRKHQFNTKKTKKMYKFANVNSDEILTFFKPIEVQEPILTDVQEEVQIPVQEEVQEEVPHFPTPMQEPMQEPTQEPMFAILF